MGISKKNALQRSSLLPSIIFDNDEEGDIIIENDRTTEYTEWLVKSNNRYYPSLPLKTEKKLPAGVYDIEYDSRELEFFVVKKDLNLNELIMLPNPIFETIVNDMKFFWSNEEIFKNYDFKYKRGLLLYGEPGSGKSSLISLLSNMVINDFHGVVFNIQDSDDLHDYANFVGNIFRVIEKNTPVLVVIEDIDGLVSASESTLLNLLDGMYHTHNIVYIACTNYPENLKDRILNRPSRFDKRYHIGLPDENIRRYYFENKINAEDLKTIDLDMYIKETDGLSLAHLGELIKLVFIYKKDFKESLKELRGMSEYISSTKFNKNNGGIGFGGKKKY